MLKPMRPPWWKKWISYIRELPVESASSDVNPELYVCLSQGRYQLCTANAVYSYEDLYDNFYQAFRKLPLDDMQIEHVLVLGLGLGSIPYMLERKFRKKYYYTAVEVDEAVIYLAQKYALSDLKSGIEVVRADAGLFVDQTIDKFDLITMDIFLDDEVPEKFEQQAFLEQLDHLLAPEGLLLYNRLSRSREDVRKTERFYREVFCQVFPEADYLDLQGNWMLLNRRPAS